MTHRLKFIAVSGIISAPAIQSQNCNLSEYKPAPGLTADDGQKDPHSRLGWRKERRTPPAPERLAHR
jgi:hypothetical protein